MKVSINGRLSIEHVTKVRVDVIRRCMYIGIEQSVYLDTIKSLKDRIDFVCSGISGISISDCDLNNVVIEEGGNEE